MQDFKKPDRVLVFKDDDPVEQSVDTLSLVSAIGDIAGRLLAYQKNFVEGLLANFEKNNLKCRVSLCCYEQFLTFAECLCRTLRLRTQNC